MRYSLSNRLVVTSPRQRRLGISFTILAVCLPALAVADSPAVPAPASAAAASTAASAVASGTAVPAAQSPMPAAAVPVRDAASVSTTQSGTVHGLSLSAGGSEFDLAASLGYRVRLSDNDPAELGRVELGADVETGSLREGFIAGYAVKDGQVTRGRLWAGTRLLRRGGFAIDGHIAPGVRLIRGATGVSPTRTDSTAVSFDTGLMAKVRLSPRAQVEAGILLPFSLEIAPEVVNDVVGTLFSAGVTVDVGQSVQAFANLETGGIFGADGDAGKYLTRGSAGVRMLLGGDTQSWHGGAQTSVMAEAEADSRPQRRGAPIFVDMGWRALGLADHASHGPSFQLGVVLFDRLKLGIGGFSRPGPINSKTFALDLPEGMTYRGQDTLALRSDGSMLGLLVAPMFDLPRTSLRLEVPVTVGFAGFGFYLHGDDRNVPDDRRVSEWEDEFLGGSDSGFSLAVDAGARISYVPEAGFWQPYIGVHYTATPGYQATMTDDYSGLSAVVGVQLGAL